MPPGPDASAYAPGPDATAYADAAVLTGLLEGASLADVRVERLRWELAAEPGNWFDTVAAAMSRSGAVLTRLDPVRLAAAHADYVETAHRELRPAGQGGRAAAFRRRAGRGLATLGQPVMALGT